MLETRVLTRISYKSLSRRCISKASSPKWVLIGDPITSRLLTLWFPVSCFRYRRRGLYAVSPLYVLMADSFCWHASPLCVIVGDVDFVTRLLSSCYRRRNLLPFRISYGPLRLSHIFSTDTHRNSQLTDMLKHYWQKIKHSTFRYHKFKIQHSTRSYKINIQQAVTSRYKTINSFKTTNSFTRTNFAVLSTHLRPWKQVCLSMIRHWIIAVELSLLRDHLIHDEWGQLFSNGVQIIIAEGGCRHFELLHWKHKVSKELATCRDKIAIIEYIYLTL